MKFQNLSIQSKLTLSLSAIAAVLLISCIISVMEYSRMSSYVSDMIAEDIKNINVSQHLSEEANAYNLAILAAIGETSSKRLPDYDPGSFMARCDSLRSYFSADKLPLADSVEYAFSAYMLTSLELGKVLRSDFIDSRAWYFERLQPRYNTLCADIDALSAEIYNDLKKNSATFERGFYRSIIPGIVAVGVGLLLIFMLLFFLLAYYVRPLNRIAVGLAAYKSMNKRYTLNFEGDDQLHDINEGIREITEENLQLRRRVLRRGDPQ